MSIRLFKSQTYVYLYRVYRVYTVYRVSTKSRLHTRYSHHQLLNNTATLCYSESSFSHQERGRESETKEGIERYQLAAMNRPDGQTTYMIQGSVVDKCPRTLEETHFTCHYYCTVSRTNTQFGGNSRRNCTKNTRQK